MTEATTPGRRVMVALAALAAAASALAVLQWQRAEDLAADEADEQAAVQAARDFMGGLFTYRFDDFDAQVEEVLAGGTDRFDGVYLETVPTFRQTAEQTEAVAVSTVRDAWVGDRSGNDITVIVLLDTDNRSLVGRRQLIGAWFRVFLEHHDGRWLVDEWNNFFVEDQLLETPDGQPAPSPGASEAPTSPSPSPAAT